MNLQNTLSFFLFLLPNKNKMKSILFFGLLLSITCASPTQPKKQFKIGLKKVTYSKEDLSALQGRPVSYLVKQDQKAYNHGSGKSHGQS